MALPLLLLLSVYYRYTIIVPVPVPGIPTSGHQPDIRSTAPVRSTSLFAGGSLGSPRGICGMGSIATGISSRRVTAALGRPQKFPRKVPGQSQQESDDG